MIFGIVVLCIGIVAGSSILVAFLRSLWRFEPVALPKEEEVIARARAFLVVDGRTPGKNGEVVLTSRRIIWRPIRFPFPRSEVRSILLEQIRSCDIGHPTAFHSRPIVVRESAHEFSFALDGEIQSDWTNWILEARDAAV